MAAALALLVFAGAVFYALTRPDVYSSSAVVIFNPRNTPNGSVVGAESVASTAAGYANSLGAASTLDEVAAEIGSTRAAIKQGLEVRLLPATSTLSISFESGQREAAARGANAMAGKAVDRTLNDPVVQAEVLAPAAIPGSPSGPPRVLMLFAGAILAVIVGASVLALAWLRRNPLGRTDPTEEAGRPAGPDDAQASQGAVEQDVDHVAEVGE